MMRYEDWKREKQKKLKPGQFAESAQYEKNKNGGQKNEPENND